MCHFAAGGLGIKYESAICRSSLLKGDALPLSAGPVVQHAENTESIKETVAIHPSQAPACSLSQPYRPKYCHRVSEFKERLRVFVDLLPIPDTCPLCIQPDTSKGRRRKEENEKIHHHHWNCTISLQQPWRPGAGKYSTCSGLPGNGAFLPLCKILLNGEKTSPDFLNSALYRYNYILLVLHRHCSAIGHQIPSSTRE